VSLKSKKLENKKLEELENKKFFSTVIFHKDFLEVLNQEFEKVVGEKAASAVSFRQGLSVGRNIAKNFKGVVPFKNIQRIMSKFVKIGEVSGLFEKVYFAGFKNKKYVMIVKTSISNKKYNLKIKKCSFVAGEAEGIVETITGEKVTCRETECVSCRGKYDKFVIELKK